MSPRGSVPLILLLFVAVSLVTRAPFLSVPFLDLDEAAALVGAQELMRGGTLYVDVADNRPPLLYGFYALAQALFGPGVPAVRLLIAAAVLPLTALAASAFFRHDRRGILAGLLYLAYGAGFLAHDMHSASPEVLMLLPLAAALAGPPTAAPRPPSPSGASGASSRWPSGSDCRWRRATAGSRRAARLRSWSVVPQASLTGYVPGNRASRAGDIDTRSLVREEDWDLLMADLSLRRPAFVVDTAPSGLHGWGRFPLEDFPRLRDLVKAGYYAVAVVDGAWIWRRKACEAGAAR